MTILLTGFTPFAEHRVNPSALIVEALAGQDDLVTAILPTEYATVGEQLLSLIREHEPDGVMALGLSAKREGIHLERFALNVDDAVIADNAGLIRSGQAIVPEGPAAYTSTLPLAAMREALEARKIPVAISNHAGAFLCNHVFYTARHHFAQAERATPTGFIHVPAIAQQDDDPGLPLETMIEAVTCCLDVLRGDSSIIH